MAIDNEQAAEMAGKFINSTNRHVFLTGKAGTGKTTFLKKIREVTHKKNVVAAPTGIAAINAGGVTLHSLFQLPFGSFIPSNTFVESQSRNFELHTPRTLVKNLQMHSHKRNLLREIELLIIDEVSMLRADLLDAIDTVLRYVRRQRYTPFGGVQVLFIGDLQQLPPVVKNSEYFHLRSYYSSMFFFDAVVLQKQKPLYIELEKIYRQSDQTFITVLNHLRDNKLTTEDVEILNRNYKPGFKPKSDDGYVYLTTHNRKADNINEQALKRLNHPSHTFHAEITGKFPAHIYPVDEVLELKEDAQIMFIKNDISGEQRYFNGKIGKVAQINEDKILVRFNDGSDSVYLEKYTWENKRFKLNKKNNQIEEEIIGRFIHYPVKLAWAITVHKSQGLTFERAIIDISEAFAPGQVYVALSRLTSLDGLVLTAKMAQNGLAQDPTLQKFAQTKDDKKSLKNKYEDASRDYIGEFVMQVFDFYSFKTSIEQHVFSYKKDESKSEKQKYRKWAEKLLHEHAVPVKEVADKFLKQLKRIIISGKDSYINELQERVTAAKGYFEPLLKKMKQNVKSHIGNVKSQKRVKSYLNELDEIDIMINSKIQNIYKAEAIIEASIKNIAFTKENLNAKIPIEDKKDADKGKNKPHEPKPPKQSSKKTSFNLYKEGKSIEEIAQHRGLAVSTIEGHLSHFVRNGEIDVYTLLDKSKVDTIIKAAEKLNDTKLSPIKNVLSDDFSYTDLRFAMAYYKYQQEKQP